MSDFIEDFYYGNIEPQECTSKLTPKVKKTLNELASKEEHLTSLLTDKVYKTTKISPSRNRWGFCFIFD